MKKNAKKPLIWTAIGLTSIGIAGKTTLFFTGRKQKSSRTGNLAGQSPLNWPWIINNIGKELNHTTPKEKISPNAMRSYRWVNDHTLEVRVREGERFPDSTPVTASTVKLNFESGLTAASRSVSNSETNFDPKTRCEIRDEYTLHFHLPETVDRRGSKNR